MEKKIQNKIAAALTTTTANDTYLLKLFVFDIYWLLHFFILTCTTLQMQITRSYTFYLYKCAICYHLFWHSFNAIWNTPKDGGGRERRYKMISKNATRSFAIVRWKNCARTHSTFANCKNTFTYMNNSSIEHNLCFVFISLLFKLQLRKKLCRSMQLFFGIKT